MIDFGRKRAIIRGNTTWIEGGVELEAIPPGPNGYAPGMILVSAEWHRLYFLIRREGWTENEYFDYAKRLMELHGIKNP